MLEVPTARGRKVSKLVEKLGVKTMALGQSSIPSDRTNHFLFSIDSLGSAQ